MTNKVIFLLIQDLDTPLVPDHLRWMLQAILLLLVLCLFQDNTYTQPLQIVSLCL